MSRSILTSLLGSLTAAMLVASTASVPLAGQTRKVAKPAKAAVPAKTPWGDPNLQGVYTFSTLTPLERPNTLAAKTALTETELAEVEEKDAESVVKDTKDRPGDPGTYNKFWTETEKGRRTDRTSLITDPENGRIPEMTPDGKKHRAELAAEAGARRIGTPPFIHILYQTWWDLPSYTQCIARPFPRLAQSYNHGVQILQSPGYVVILYETMHNARIIPLDGRPHLADNIRLWDGDARGHWEGNTLVVDWANFDPRQEFQGASQKNQHFTERLTRVDATTINYQVTVNDPTVWTKPWTFLQPWHADDANYQHPEDLYEYACHEGNYRQIEDALAGARTLEAANPNPVRPPADYRPGRVEE